MQTRPGIQSDAQNNRYGNCENYLEILWLSILTYLGEIVELNYDIMTDRGATGRGIQAPVTRSSIKAAAASVPVP